MIDTAVIMAAGLGSRLKERTKEIPKGFLEIDGVSLIERSVNLLKEHGVTKVIIGTGYLSEHYENLAKKYSEIICVQNDIYAKTSSFYTLYNMRDKIESDFLLLESDLFYEKLAIATLQDIDKKDVILSSGKTNSGDEVYIEADKNNSLIKMSKIKDELGNVSGELVGISKISIDCFKRICGWAKTNKDKIKKYDYESVLVEVSSSGPIYVEKIDDLLWAEIDDESHLNRVLEIINPKIRAKENER